MQSIWEYPRIVDFASHIAEQLNKHPKKHDVFIKHEHLQKQAPIAIIGMGCRFPGNINDVETFWNYMLSGQDPITEVPDTRWNVNKLYDEDYQKPGKMSTRYGGFLTSVDCFDANFFNISPKEAKQMDPQQRLFLEVAWQAIEHAALNPEDLERSSTGVFVGVSMHDYEHLQAQTNGYEQVNAYSNLGTASSSVGARLSYFLGLNGPSFAIDTACSSSMAALYQASLCLRSGDCDMAFVGGVNLILSPEPSIGYSQAHMLAPDGHCKTFDEQADGYVRSEGCGVILLKRLDSALADGDRIYAVIRSTVANQDGASSGITAPNMLAQKQMLLDGLFCADLQPEDIDFFETHGTGTYLGDPIEVDAINQVYASATRTVPLYLGAIKSQIGHCEAAAGITGIIKTALALYHGTLPANLHFSKLNPQINLDPVPCAIPTKTTRLPGTHCKRAAVSSYGFTGTNTHAILEQAPRAQPKNQEIQLPKEQLFVLSAKTSHALQELITSYKNYLTTTQNRLEDICYTTAIGRSHFNYRIALIVQSKEELIDLLDNPELTINETVDSDALFTNNNVQKICIAYLSGKKIDWLGYYKPYSSALCKVNLPTYTFDRQHYWLESKRTNQLAYGPQVHELLGSRLPGAGEEVRLFNVLSTSYSQSVASYSVFL